jgi:hypothetical protein
MRALFAATVVLGMAESPVRAADVPLSAVQFPERSSVSLKLLPTQRASAAEGKASVKFRRQARVELD